MNNSSKVQEYIQDTENHNNEILRRISGPHLHLKAKKINENDLYETIDIDSFIDCLQEIIIKNGTYVSERDFTKCLVQNTNLYTVLKRIFNLWNSSDNIDIIFKEELPRQVTDDPSDIKYSDPYKLVIDKTHPRAKSFEWTLKEILTTSLNITNYPEIKVSIENALIRKAKRIQQKEEMETILENSRFGGQN